MIIFKDYLTSLLPDYIIQNDSYKDVNSKGFVQRYLEIFGEELDEFYYPLIENLEVEFNPLTSQVQYLDYYATMLGDIHRFIDNDTDYRRFLTLLISIYKVKGTKKSYTYLFQTIGLNATVQEIAIPNYLYDSGLNYDEAETLYDINCATCSEYDLNITGTPVMTEALLNRILDMVSLLEPINAKLKTIIYNGSPILIDGIFDESFDFTFE